MIEIIPSIAIIAGKCIRLKQGDFSSEKVYYDNPLDVAKKFEDSGIKKIHLVDLDGAREGKPVNYHVLELIAGHTNLNINFAGGIQTDGDIGKSYEYGAKSITASSIAVTNKTLFASWIISYGRERIMLGADGLNQKIAIKGWLKETDIDLFDHIDFFYSRSLKYVKSTDIAKDGLLKGPSFNLYKEIIARFPDISVLASGGIRSVEDIEELEKIGVHGVIFGKAFYEGKIKLKSLEKFF